MSAPTQLRATNQTLTTLTIQWRQTQDAQQGYEIQWCNGNCNPNDEWDNTTTIAERETTTHTIENLNLQTTYKIRIKALKTQTRQSRYATITYTMVLPKPTNTTTTAHTTTSVTLNWQQVDGATAGYEIQYKKPTQTSWSTAITATSTETSKQIPTLDSGTTYQVRIRALRTNTPNNIPSAYTTITTTTTPEPPTALRFSNQTTNSTTLSWTAPTQGDNLTYAIEYCSNLTNCQVATPQGSWTTTKTLTSSTTTITIPQLTQSTQYNIRVRTTKTINNATTNSSWIASSFITKPEAPTIGSIEPANSTSLSVTWTQVTGANGGYEIQYCKLSNDCQADGQGSHWTTDPADSNGGTKTETSQATITTTITGLTTASEYRVRMRSKKTLATPTDTQYSDWTTSQNATPALSYPATFGDQSQDATSITVQWTQNTDATGGYQVQYCTASSANCDTSGTGTDWTATTTAGQKGQVQETATATTSTTISSLNSATNYRVRIRSIQTTPSAQSPWSAPILTTTTPASPTPTSSAVTGTAFTINWTKPTGTKTGAGAFEYGYCQHHATNCTTTGTGSSYSTNTATDTKLQETITGRTPATQYNFRVRAVKTLNATDYKSAWATISTLTTPPTPTLTFGSRTSTAITVNWTAITGANNGYRVEYCKSSATCDTAQTGSDWGGAQTNTATKGSTDITAQATIQHQFTGLTTDSTYLFRIASKAEGSSNTITSQSAWSTTFTAIPTSNPSAPTALTAGTTTKTSIALSWTAPATAPSGGYQIQHCQQSGSCNANGNGNDWNKTDNIVDVPTDTSRTFTSLAEGRNYNFRVRSVKTSTPNAYSAWTTIRQISTKLSTPTNLQASTGANNTSLSVSWTGITATSAYKTRICANVPTTANCNTGSNWTEDTHTSTSVTISNLVAGTSYQVQVRSVFGSIESPWTSSQTQSTSGTQPTVSSATISTLTPSNGQVALVWSTATGVDGYQVQYCKVHATDCQANGQGSRWTTSPADANGGTIPVSGQSSTTTTVSSLTNGSEYRFRIRTYKNYSNPSMTLYSAWSGSRNATPVAGPSSPTGLSASAASRTSISMSWTISASTGSGLATGYQIQRCTGATCGNANGAGWANASTTPAQNTFTRATASATVTGLSANTAYRVRIRATNAIGNSAWVTSSSVTTVALANPSGYGITEIAPGFLTVSWTALSGATGGYDVQYKPSSSSSWTTISRSSATATKETLGGSGVTNGTSWDIRMRAKTTSNTYSAWQQVTQTTGNGGMGALTVTITIDNAGGQYRDYGRHFNDVSGATHFIFSGCQGTNADCTPSGFPYTNTVKNEADSQNPSSGRTNDSWQSSSGAGTFHLRVRARARKGSGTVADPYYYSAEESAYTTSTVS